MIMSTQLWPSEQPRVATRFTNTGQKIGTDWPSGALVILFTVLIVITIFGVVQQLLLADALANLKLVAETLGQAGSK